MPAQSSQLAAFDEDGHGGSKPPDTLSVKMSSQTTASRATPISSRSPQSATVRSALWAAWGDALGFPAEMASQRMLQRRLDSTEQDGWPTAWSRRIGGRMGPTVELPAGCTSDDTQLRLAVARCIRTTGRFDVEAFSKVELPVFLSYQLGAGRGTKAAAHALSKRATRWFSNFFDDRASNYVNCGGNGAAMRIQPHVWAARDAKPETYLAPMLRDVVCTHGHPRGILGASLHALALGTALHQGSVPEPDRWPAMVDHLSEVEQLMATDDALGERWLPAWERAAARKFSEALAETITELQHQVEQAHAASLRFRDGDDGLRVYSELVRALGGMRKETRGAGTITAVLSLWLAWAFSSDPIGGLQGSALLINSDTDTISTMAGALLGVVATDAPPGELLDRELIAREARRLEGLAREQPMPSFPHPDPLHWAPPSYLADALGLIEGQPAVAGLGPVRLLGEPIPGDGNRDELWQWVITEYGQTLLVKRRPELRELPAAAQPRSRPNASPGNGNATDPVSDQPRGRSEFPADPAQGVEFFLSHRNDDRLLGLLLRHYARQGPTPAAVFATLVSSRLSSR
jgi:ADP-ribosylglycohydrolase